MKLFLAGENYKSELIMEIFLAGQRPWCSEGLYKESITKYRPFILESFYSINEDMTRLLPYFSDFLLDSGAFSFMRKSKDYKKEGIQWEEYIEKYAAYIQENNIEKFFELDIDSIVGYDKVISLRKKLEKLTGKQCIPVWHKSRGLKEFTAMCQEYSYVALGGIATKEISQEQHKFFPSFIKIAHDNGAKIHGLGYTNLSGLPKYHFDSVDSTAWTAGNRFGRVDYFNGKTIKTIKVPEGKRLKDAKQIAINNFIEWIKFQKYADKMF